VGTVSKGLFGRFGIAVAFALLAVACNGGDQGEIRSESPTPVAMRAAAPTASPTAAPSVEDQVSQAYLRYWDAYAEALLNLDPALAEGVASGQELQRIREEIETLRSQGVALRVVVEHNSVVLEASENSAVVFDEIVNNSFYVDPETKEPPVGSGSGEILRDTFYFEKIDGRWMVVRSTRQR
jgi:hypothetical protein